MYYAYVLKSKGYEYYYKGHCQDLQMRLAQHNSRMTVSIRPYLPFEIVYFEAFDTEIEAITREKYFKTGGGRRFLKNKLGS
jgi:putative endonuclease